MDRVYKKIWLLFFVIYCAVLAYGLCLHFCAKDWNGVFMCFVAFLSLISVPFIFGVLKFRPVYEIYCIQVVFAFVACVLGSCFGWYRFPFFDKILHFSSGFLMLTVAIMFYFLLKRENQLEKKDQLLFYLFINSVNISIAVFWEFFEYSMLIFFGNDCINHYTQGVHDSMTDMLCATLAGFLLTLWIIKRKTNFFMNTANKFYEYNVKKRTY